MTGQPLIQGTVASLECVLQDEFRAGDHYVETALVVDAATSAVHHPLLFYKGDYAWLVDGGPLRQTQRTEER